MSESERESFVHTLSHVAELSDEPLELDPAAAAELRAALDGIDEYRARSSVSAHDYAVWR